MDLLASLRDFIKQACEVSVLTSSLFVSLVTRRGGETLFYMVLVPWPMASQDSSMRTFDGGGDVSKFLFYFVNVLAWGKTDSEKAELILSHLVGAAFNFYYNNFGGEWHVVADCQQL